jgi:hypothetical protein
MPVNGLERLGERNTYIDTRTKVGCIGATVDPIS